LGSTGAEVIAVATGVETVVLDPIPLLPIVVGKGVGVRVAVGVGDGTRVVVGTGVGVGVAVGVGTAVRTAFALASTVASMSGVAVGAGSAGTGVALVPHAASNSISTGGNRNGRINLSFISCPL
jgi:hypothetical protein